jgi:hypothetical protein
MHRCDAMRARDDHAPARTHLDPPALEREVEPTRPWLRRRRTQRAIIAGSLAVIAASGTVVWLRVVSVRGTSSTEPISASPTEDEVPSAALASDDAIGDPVTGEVADHPDGWLGVAASPDRYGVIAAWSDHILWISRDDGRTFHQELAAPEPIGAATIAAGARVYVARHGGRFGLLTPAGHTRWLWLDYEQALAIATGGGWTVLLAMSPDRHAGLIPILWATEDDGASWRRLVAPAAGDLDNRLHVGSDGTIDLLVRVTGDLAPRIRHYRGDVDGRPFAALLDAEDPQPFGLGHDGSTARLVWTGDGARPAAQLVFPASSAPLPDRLAISDWDVLVGAGPDWTLAVADRRLLALTGTHVQPLSVEVPGRVRGLTGDGIGRSLALVGRLILRHSTSHSWRRLFELPAVESLPR